MSSDILIQEWQDILKRNHGKDFSKGQLLTCILHISKKHNISITESIGLMDNFLME